MSDLIDSRLNRITMYRLVLYVVGGLLVAAFGLGFFGLVPSDPTALTFSTFVILSVCWVTNRVFANLLKVPANAESTYITACILALIMAPTTSADLAGVAGLALASFAAVASKYVLAIHHKHIFNPVAIGVAAAALTLDQSATWWVGGNLFLMPLVIIGGLLIARKVQRFDMIVVYVLANLTATLALTRLGHYGEALTQTFVESPLLFAGFVMLTEPLTAPHARNARVAYGAIVGVLSSPNIHISGFYFTPEIAFLVGNVFAWAVSPKGRLRLTLVGIEKMAAGCYEFVFASNRKLNFRPGQYLDWTLQVDNPDDRGNRRPFTIASAPTEQQIRLGVKFYPKASAFKRALAKMRPGDVIYASGLAGEFTLPKNEDEKIAFIAGGIGVTPFRSMVQELLDNGVPRPIVMFYGANTADELAYAGIFDQAEQELGIRTVYAVAQGAAPDRENVRQGFIDAAMIERELPDYDDRTFYLSGPRAMVLRFQSLLKELGVDRRRIKVDYFPGFA